jgi:hypothetical protein
LGAASALRVGNVIFDCTFAQSFVRSSCCWGHEVLLRLGVDDLIVHLAGGLAGAVNGTPDFLTGARVRMFDLIYDLADQ